jgi:acyl dehydratase
MVNWDRRFVGKVFSRFEQHVTHQMVLDYAHLIGVTDPIYVDQEAAQAQGYRDIIALPTFITWRGGTPIVPSEMGFTGSGINAGYDCTFYHVVYPGDTLIYSTALVDMYEKTGRTGTMRFVVRETTVTNQDGITVARVRNSFILGW